MLRRPLRLVRDIATLLQRVRALEERCADTQIELQQFISLSGMWAQVPAIPPKRLQIRVAGAYKPLFFRTGRNLLDDIEDLLKANGYSLFAADNILDFGCGCGRVLIPLSFLIDPAKVVGTDIDKQAINWLSENYPSFKSLDRNKVKPPTKYPDATFDVIYGVSVFTHLPEDMQDAWLGEMSRILKPGGVGVFTTHGERFYSQLKAPALDELMERGFYYSVGEVTEGLPEFYQTSFQTHDYIRREWAKHFEVVAIRKEGITKYQDAVLVRKRSQAPA